MKNNNWIGSFFCVATVIVGGGCGDSPTDDGLRVFCDGQSAGLHFNKITNIGPCTGDCVEPVYEFELCLGPDQYSETGGVDLETWVDDQDDIEYLRSLCVQECKQHAQALGGECDENPGTGIYWQVENYEHFVVPDPLNKIDDPEKLECTLPQADIGPIAGVTTVIPATSSPLWPSSPTYSFTVDCGDFETCAADFMAPILQHLAYDDTLTLWDEMMGNADYTAATSGTSATSLTLRIENPTYTSSDTNSADGEVEYSAPDCGDTECPFYLANLTLTNTADTWQLYSNDLSDDVYVTDIVVQLRRPTLGVWNTSTNEVYIGEERIDMYLTGTVQIGSGSPQETTILASNVDAIYGEIGTGGEIEALNLVVGDGSALEAEADLDYDTLIGSPPVANHGLGSTASAPNASGLPISSITDVSSDPDNDIESKFWIVDGVERSTAYVIPTGLHVIELWVMDERGALDAHRSRVDVQYP